MTQLNGHIRLTPEIDAALSAYALPLDFFEHHLMPQSTPKLMTLRAQALSLISDLNDLRRNTGRVALKAQLEDIVADVEAEVYFRQERAYVYEATDGTNVVY